ncbi:MAG: YicC family protein [Candidatus Marinimicrobia bacterium]|nr:YicC family protein [Candidatus Neomarinimicrobiota bacterium]MCF7850709.1 YicC family protein [Candidatus Neomarinimicrobiota bacterium]MCF7904910.1 YicC family protein [Candidatus Neomarinimicrobiota bacterium]
MLISMTGFGRAEDKIGDTNVAIELRAVNSRYLEFVMRFPRGFEKLEDEARNHLQQLVKRGRVTVTMNVGSDQTSLGKPHLNEELLQHYQQLTNRSAELLGSDDATIPLEELLKLPDVISYVSDAEDQEKFMLAALEMLRSAADQLQAMRIREGELLEKNIHEQLSTLNGIVTKIRENDHTRLDTLVEKLRKKLTDSPAENDFQIDEKRLEQEIVIWSDKLDITEELTRMDAHVQHFSELMKEDGDAGKRLNFLLQEMNREANTIGSKANSTPIAHAVVELKNEIERIREQVQNIQ